VRKGAATREGEAVAVTRGEGPAAAKEEGDVRQGEGPAAAKREEGAAGRGEEGGKKLGPIPCGKP
jgi:hypothetical protein